MLRLFFETFAGLDEIGSVGRDEFAAILKSYIEEKMERLDNPEAGYWALTLIAGAFFDESVKSRSRREGDDEHPVLPQRISVERIRELANGDFSEEFVPSLCNTGVINAFKNERGREEVGFVYERVRDHILAVHYLDYEGDLGDDGSRLFKDLDAPATRPVTLLHLGTAPDTLWRVFKRYWEQRLHRFLETYSQLREALGPSLRGNIDPYTNSEIRIVYELDRLGRYVWALAAAEDASELVQEYPSLGRLMWSHRQSDEAFRIMHGGDDFALLVDPDVFAAKHFREEIVALTTKAGLEESNSRVLSIEKVLAILHTHRKRLGLPAAKAFEAAMFVSDLLPLSKSDVEEGVHIDWGFEDYLECFRTDYEMRSVSYPKQQTEARKRATLDVSRGRRFKGPKYVNAPPFEELLNLLDLICSEDGEIPVYVLSPPDAPWDPRMYRASIERFYSDEQLVRLIEEVIPIVVREYNRVVIESFPGFSSLIDLGNWSRVGLVLDYIRAGNPDELGTVRYGVVDDAKDAPWVDVEIDPLTSRINWNSEIANTRRGRLKIRYRGETSLYRYVYPTVHPLSFGSRADLLKGPCWIRSAIYSMVVERLNELTPFDFLTGSTEEVHSED